MIENIKKVNLEGGGVIENITALRSGGSCEKIDELRGGGGGMRF